MDHSRAAIALALTGSLLLGACASEDPGIPPPLDRFYFPTALALDPEWPVLYLANANADLQHNGGTINVLQLARLPASLAGLGQVIPGQLDCHADPFDLTVWECPEEQFLDPAATIRIGDFPSDLRVSPDRPQLPGRSRRLFVPVRGANHLLWAEAARLDDSGATPRYDLRCHRDCPQGSRVDCEIWDCDADHTVNYSEELRTGLPAEPFGIEVNPITAVVIDSQGQRRTCLDGRLPAVGCQCGTLRSCDGGEDRDCCVAAPAAALDHVYLTHLTGGEVSFFTSTAAGVALHDFRAGFFAATGDIRGGFSVATQTRGDPASLTYVGSRVEALLASFLILENRRILDATRAPIGALAPGNDVRGIAFGAGGEQLYIINRQPPALMAMDMRPREPGGLPRQEPLWVAEVCGEPSLLRLGPDPLRPGDPAAQLAYVVCFAAGQIFVVDTSLGRVVDQIVTGKGPNGLALDPANRRAFVANFLDNTVGVIDLDPSNPSYNRMVMRIGRNVSLLRTE